MNVPTRDDLWSDPASEAWESDARKMLEAQRGLSPLELVIDVLSIVATELDCNTGDGLVGDSEEDDLHDLATMAKRGAILLLHAADAAERTAKKGAGR